ncbi:hypothetical protein [Phytoactinopolyspora halotolerans]|uniref:Uncharacterized protein n=1 Tax=Phytoactinopolyspora halotolerans TaxID=1981512 RepID=A0A6L9SJ05_9ACTN|nr:hypothetical protein [Phytoactinopolyspora halotolerans]NEE04271.1 hypothetical protein [Phytoactinopolyspora halotolerans]
MRRLPALALPLVLTSVVACGGDAMPGADDVQVGDAPQSCDDGTELVVTDAGAPPRQIMAASPAVGASEAFDLRVEMGIDATIDGQSMPGPVLTMSIGLVTTVEHVDDEEIGMTYVFDHAYADDADMDETLQRLTGVSGMVRTTRTGQFIRSELDLAGIDPTLGESTGASLDDQLRDMMAPFPPTPVGVGSAWVIPELAEDEDIASCNIHTYRLESFDGEAYELAIESTFLIQPSTFDDAGMTFKVVDGLGSSTVMLTGSLDSPAYGHGTAVGETRMEMEVERYGTVHEQVLDTHIEMELTPRADGDATRPHDATPPPGPPVDPLVW